MIEVLLMSLAVLVPQDTTRLPTVTVSRDAARSILEIPYALSRLIPDSLRPGMKNASIDERLFLLPGVIVTNRNNPSQDPRLSIRGFGSRSQFGVRGVRVQMDGIPLTLPDGQTAIDYLDLESIGSLELIRGSASSLYGNAAGGVLDLKSREFPASRLAPSATVWMGSAGQQRLAAFVGGTSGPSEYALSLSKTETDGYRRNARHEITNGSLRLGTSLGGIRIGAGVLVHDMPVAQNPGALTVAEMRDSLKKADSTSMAKKARKEVSQVLGGLTLSAGDVNAGGTVELLLHGGARDLYNPLNFAIGAIERASGGASIRAARGMSLFNNPARVTVGVDYQQMEDDRTEYTNCNFNPVLAAPTATCPTLGNERGTLRRDQKESVTSLGPYLRAEIELASKLILTAGVRADQIKFEVQDAFITPTNPDDSGERTLRAVSPMAGIAYRISPLVGVYANYATAFETPTTTELGNKPDGSAGFNPSLDPQRSTTVEAGSRGWLAGPWASGFSYDLSVFNTQVEDELIGFDIPNSNGRRYFQNAGKTLRRGFELALGTVVGPAEFALAYGYSHFVFDEYELNGNDFANHRIPGIPMQQLQGAVTFRRSAWYATLEGEARGWVYADDANSARHPGYEVMNVRVGGRGVAGLSWFSPRFGIQNVFDRHYAASIIVNSSDGRYLEPAQGRTFYAGVTLGGVR